MTTVAVQMAKEATGSICDEHHRGTVMQPALNRERAPAAHA